MTATTHATSRHEHELVLHDGPAHLVELMAPFVREGVACGDDIVVLGDPDFVAALLAGVPDVPSQQVHTHAEVPGDRFPARDLRRFERVLSPLVREGSRVRVVNQMPPMSADRWLEWRRYEAAVDVVLSRYPVWGTCGYDLAALAPGTLADLRASHPHVRTSDGRHASPEYGHPAAGTDHYFRVPAHRVEDVRPTLSLPDPTAAEARHAVRDLAVVCGLPPTAQEAVTLASSEAVTNATTHGTPPVLLRAWAEEGGRLTVAVSDAGPGPDPLVGLVPGARRALSGHGMWIVHLLLPEIHHRTTDRGYTITFSADRETALSTPGG